MKRPKLPNGYAWGDFYKNDFNIDIHPKRERLNYLIVVNRNDFNVRDCRHNVLYKGKSLEDAVNVAATMFCLGIHINDG